MSRRLGLLLGLLLALGFNAPARSALATGGGSVNVAPTATARCDPGDCWVRAREFDVLDRSKTWAFEWHSSTGVWSVTPEFLPFTTAGNVNEAFHRWAVDNTGQTQCAPPGGAWRGLTIPWDVDAKRATPGIAHNRPGYPIQRNVTALATTALGYDKIWLGGSFDDTTCSLPLNVDTGGGTNWSSSLAIMGDGVHVFITGLDGAVWNWRDGWFSVGGGSLGSPSAVSWDQSGRLDVFIRGQDNALWHRAYNAGTWFGWESLGGVLASGPGCASWAVNRIDCFAIGSDGASFWHIAWDGLVWSPWQGLG